MNHLKHIRINVPRCASSNAALPLHYGHHTDNINFENRRFKSQFLGSNTLSTAKKNHGIGIKYSGQFRQNNLRLVSKERKTICKQRSRTKSSVTSLKKKSSFNKKLPLESIARTVRHYSTRQNVIFNRINKEHVSQEVPTTNSAKNTNRHNSFIASVEKHPRSYAEMIADYSKILYKESAQDSRNDSLYCNNTIRMSPFSTFSTSSSAKRVINITEHNRIPCEERKDDSFLPTTAVKFDRCIQRDNTNIDKRRDFQYYDTETINKSQNCVTNNLTDDDQSYVRLVADCSKSVHNIPFLNISNGGLVPKRNVLAKNSLESLATPARKASSTNTQEALQKTIPLIAAMPLEKNINEQTTNSKEDWLGEMENVISDLKSFTDRKNAKTCNVSKLEENDILQFKSSNSLSRVHRLTEFIETYERKKEDTVDRKLHNQFDKVHKMKKLNKDLDLRKHNYSQFNDKTSNLPRYFSNATNNASVRKHSTQVPAGDSSTLKQPQVKLRMVPSEKESIVSINVDSASTGLLDPQNPASKQLSVVVQSDQKEDLQSTENQWNIPTLQRSSKSASQRSDFGPMRISISEDSAPIKQIEFSINGKPVSELKSITARTEKLDVVSSVDKIEIRIPFAKDETNTLSKSKENDLSKGTDSNMEQILNVQISANFQNKFAKSSTEEPAETINTISTPPSQTSKTHYVFNKLAKASEKTLNTNVQQNESSNTTEKTINKHKISDNIGFEIQRKTTKKTATEEANTEAGKLTKIMSTIQSPETNTYDKYESSDSRIPSKMVPWWSSSDSFNKIKKKEDDRKPLTPLSKRNEKKTTSTNLNKNLVTESSMLKETSDSKIPTKKIQSTNNEIIRKNNSGNLISYSNSSERYMESEPNLRYSFRLKPNRENPDIIPEIMENDIKIENNQTSIVESNEKVSEIKQIQPSTVSTSDTINTQSKHDNTEDKAPILPRKFKAPNNAQDFLLKRNQEKKHNDSLKQTKSINGISTTKIQNNLDDIKPIKTRKDDTLIGDVKISSTKPSTRLNNEMKKIQDSPNFSNSSKLVQTFQNQEKFFQTTQANLKSLSKSNTDKPDSLSSLKISSKTTTEKSEKAIEHIGTPIELKQNKPNNLSNPEMTMIQKLEKLTSPKLKDSSAKEFTLHKKITDQNKSPLEIIKEIQTKSSSTSKVKNNIVTKDSKNINKKIEELSSTDQSAGKLNKKSDAEITSAKIITQNPKSKSLLSKDNEENRELKTNKNRRSFSASLGFLKKPNGSAGFISSDSKMHTKSRVISNDNCSYAGKLIMKSSYPNSDRKNNISSNSQRAVFKTPRNLNNVDDKLQHHAPSVIGNATPWTNIDRPEKSMLYSAWLQRSRNDINKEKLY